MPMGHVQGKRQASRICVFRVKEWLDGPDANRPVNRGGQPSFPTGDNGGKPLRRFLPMGEPTLGSKGALRRVPVARGVPTVIVDRLGRALLWFLV